MADFKSKKIAQSRDYWYFMISVPVVEETRLVVLIFKIEQNRELWCFIFSVPIVDEIGMAVLIPVEIAQSRDL